MIENKPTTKNPFSSEKFLRKLKRFCADKAELFDDRFEYEDHAGMMNYEDWAHLDAGAVVDIDTEKAEGCFYDNKTQSWQPLSKEKDFILMIDGTGDVYRLHPDPELLCHFDSLEEIFCFFDILLREDESPKETDLFLDQLSIYLPFFRHEKELLPVSDEGDSISFSLKPSKHFIRLTYACQLLCLHKDNKVSWLEPAEIKAEINRGQLPDLREAAKDMGISLEQAKENYLDVIGYNARVAQKTFELRDKLVKYNLYLSSQSSQQFLKICPWDRSISEYAGTDCLRNQFLLAIPENSYLQWFKLFLESPEGQELYEAIIIKATEGKVSENISITIPSRNEQLKFLIEYQYVVANAQNYYRRKKAQINEVHTKKSLHESLRFLKTEWSF